MWAEQIVGAVAQPLVIAMMGRAVCNDQRGRVARGDFCQPVPTHVAEIGEDYVRHEEDTLRRVVVATLAAS